MEEEEEEEERDRLVNRFDDNDSFEQTPFVRLTRVLGFELREKIMSSRRRGEARRKTEPSFKILLRAVFKKPMPPHPQPAARVGGQAPAHQRQITTSKQDTSTRRGKALGSPSLSDWMSVLEYIVGRLQDKLDRAK